MSSATERCNLLEALACLRSKADSEWARLQHLDPVFSRYTYFMNNIPMN
jgi:hypothetical protein